MSALQDVLDGDLRRRGPRVVLAELVAGTLALASLAVFTAVASAHDAFLRAQLYVILAIGLNWVTLLAVIWRRSLSIQASAPARGRPAYRRLLVALALLVPAAVPLFELSHALRRPPDQATSE